MEAFDFAVGLGPVGAGAFVGDAGCGEGVAPGEGFVAAAVVGQDPSHRDAAVGEVGVGAFEESDGGFLALVGQISA